MPSQVQDPAFERTFSDLAYAVLQDRAPALVDYLVGFQVLDVDNEGTKAVGVFGCKVGDDWLYIPAFYLNGELKGMEMMYAKNQDIFLPNEENWVSYILNRKPMKLGQPTDVTHKDLAGTGLDTTVFRESPSQYNKHAAAADKVAELVAANDKTPADHYLLRKGASCPSWETSHLQPWTSGVIKFLSPLVPDKASYETPQLFLKAAADNWVAMRTQLPKLDVPDFLAHAGIKTTKTLLTAMTKSSAWAAGMLRYYSPHDLNIKQYVGGQLRKFIKKARNGRTSEILVHLYPDGSTIPVTDMPKQASVNEEKEVRIITYKQKDEFGDLVGLDNSDKEKLIRGDLVVKDDRPDETLSVEVRLEGPETIESPCKGGCYDMLTTDGKKTKCFVITSPRKVDHDSRSNESSSEGSPSYTVSGSLNGNPKPEVLVINMDGPGYVTKPVDQLAATPNPEDIPGLPGLPSEFGDVEGMTVGKCYALVTHSGNGTEPFRVMSKNKDEDGQTSFNVCTSLRYGEEEYEKKDDPYSWQSGTIMINSTSGKIKRLGANIYVPISARAVPIKLDGKKRNSSMNEGMPDLCPPEQIMHTAWIKNVAVPMKIFSDSNDYEITVGEIKTASRIPRRKALEFLIFDQGLGGDTAMGMLKQADLAAAKHSVYRTAIHHGDKYPSMRKSAISLINSQISGPSVYPDNRYSTYDSSIGIPGSIPYDEDHDIEALKARGNEVASVYDDNARLDEQRNTVDDTIRAASQTGQKEVFDTAVVGNLVKAVDSDNLVDKYIGDMVLGMDRVGRVFFLFLQHNKEFSERYGQEDLMELEDSLRNTFKSMGELILFLKKKSVEVSPAIDQNNTEI